ncbi:MAG: SUF system Fe-S cluster assembly protein [Candidatus Binatia bacterium]
MAEISTAEDKQVEPEGMDAALEEKVVEALRTVYDPEIPVNLYDLGLIYDIRKGNKPGTVSISMTLTTPGCPVAGSMPGMVEQAVLSVDGVEEAQVELVWDPPWNMDMMSDAARLQLGF